MRKINFFILALALLCLGAVCFAQTADDKISVGTYYPPPFGIYQYLRLNPVVGGTASGDACTALEEGQMYYDADENILLYCNGTNWQPLGDPNWKFTDNPDPQPDYLYTTDPNWFVGIERSDPELKLSVSRKALEGSTATARGELFAGGTKGSGADLQTSGAGTRLIWWPKKALFRVGTVKDNINTAEDESTLWNPDKMNNYTYSIAMGYNANAEYKSIALGRQALAKKDYGLAIGYNTLADGNYSGITAIAIGQNASALNSGAIAIGRSVTASGVNSIIIGKGRDGIGNALVNNINQSLVVGFSLPPTLVLFVGPGSGTGTYGQVAVRTTTPPSGYAFYVNGPAGGNDPGGWPDPSDQRLKQNIQTIDNALAKVMKLRGVNFQWKDPKTYSPGVKMGLIAQEAEDIIPEVITKSDKYYSMQYGPIVALLIEAVKQQQLRIDRLKAILAAEN